MSRTRGKPATLSLEYCVKKAAAIGICRCRAVESVGGILVARVTVEQPIKGCQKGQELFYLNERTWTCDVTKAEVGEQTLLFLDTLPEHPFQDAEDSTLIGKIRLFDSARQRELRGIPLYQVYHSGNGRMPLKSWGGQVYTYRRPPIYLPDTIPTINQPGPYQWAPERYAPLPLVLTFINKYLAEMRRAAA